MGSLFGGGASSASDASAAAANTEANISKNLFNFWKTNYAPLETSMVNQAELPTSQQPGYLGAVGSTNNNYNNLINNLRATTAGTYSYGSGLTSGATSTANMNRVRDLSTAYQNADSQRFSNLYNLAGLGRNLTGQAQSGLSSAANTDLSLSNSLYKQNMQTAQGIGSTIGNLGAIGLLGNL